MPAAAVVAVKHAMSLCEDFIYILLQGPGGAHPPAGELIDDGVGFQDGLNLIFHIIAVLNDRLADRQAMVFQTGCSKVLKGLIQLASGVGKRFCAIDEMDMGHVWFLPVLGCGDV